MNGERVPCSGDPPWPPGTTPAATGIKNHGNTCYMNAVLQCLSHSDVIAEYFVLDHYKVCISKNVIMHLTKMDSIICVIIYLAVLKHLIKVWHK